MKTFVNFLSAFRILAAFVMIPLLWMVPRATTHAMLSSMAWAAFIVFAVAAMTDFFDGWLAKKYNVVTKLGGVMDHIGDKLLVANTFIVLAIITPSWFVAVPIIIMIARELYISGLREFLGTQKIEMPVPSARMSMGKIKTTLQMVTITAFLLIYVVASVMQPNSAGFIIRVLYALPNIALIGLWLSLIASVWSATQYTFTFIEKLKKIK